MENPRKRIRRNNQKTDRAGQIIDFKAYQDRRRREEKRGHRKDRKNTQASQWSASKYPYAHALCYALMGIGLILALLGMAPAIAFNRELTVWSLFLGTIGLVCGLVLHSLRDGQAMRLLLLQCGIFVVLYLFALVSFVV